MGYDEAAATVQDLYLSREYDAAAQAVPYEFLDQTALLGPKERIAEKMQDLARSGVTTLTLSPFVGDLEERRGTAAVVVDPRAGVDRVEVSAGHDDVVDVLATQLSEDVGRRVGLPQRLGLEVYDETRCRRQCLSKAQRDADGGEVRLIASIA